MPCPEDILRSCGSLIGLSESHNSRVSVAKQVNNRTVSAAHASVVEFLRRERVRIGSVQEFSLTLAGTNLEMAQICLVYLLNIIESSVPLDHSILISHPMAHLSAELWVGFYLEAIRNTVQDLTGVHRLITRLLRSPSAFLKWSLLSSWEKDSSRVPPTLNCLDMYMLESYMRSMGMISDEICPLNCGQSTKKAMKILEKCDMRHNLESSEDLSAIRWLRTSDGESMTFELWIHYIFLKRKDTVAVKHELDLEPDPEDGMEKLGCGCANTKTDPVYEFVDYMKEHPERAFADDEMEMLERERTVCGCDKPMPDPVAWSVDVGKAERGGGARIWTGVD